MAGERKDVSKITHLHEQNCLPFTHRRLRMSLTATKICEHTLPPILFVGPYSLSPSSPKKHVSLSPERKQASLLGQDQRAMPTTSSGGQSEVLLLSLLS